MALGNTYSLVSYWSVLDFGAKASKVAGICFNFLLIFFFYWMFSNNKKTEEGVGELMKDEDMIKLLGVKNESSNLCKS